MRPPGGMELIIILVIVLVLFGAKRLPGLGSALGSAIRGFKRGISGKDYESGSDIEPAEGSQSHVEKLPAASTPDRKV